MPRPKLNLTEEERQERLKQQRRKNSLAYYHRKHPKTRTALDTVDEMKEYIDKRKEYFKKYYEQHKEELIKKSSNWKKNQK